MRWFKRKPLKPLVVVLDIPGSPIITAMAGDEISLTIDVNRNYEFETKIVEDMSLKLQLKPIKVIAIQ